MLLSSLPVGSLVKDINTKYNNDVIIWQILEHGHSGDPAGSTTLQSRDILTLKSFDAKEPNGSANYQQYGNANYNLSNILQWLNSDLDDWYSPAHSKDEAPSSSYVSVNPYESESGFLTNFSDTLKNLLITASKKVSTSQYYSFNVSSKVFLLSRVEVGLGGEIGYAEGMVYSFFNVSSNRIKNLMNDAAKGDYPAGSPWQWWLRTIDKDKTYKKRIISYTGSIDSSEPYLGNCGVAPAICIPSNVEVLDLPDEYNVYAFRLPPVCTKVYIGNSNNIAVQVYP